MEKNSDASYMASGGIGKDDEMKSALRKWLKRVADPGGTTNQEIFLMSFSLKKRSRCYLGGIDKGISIRRDYKTKKEFESPHFDKRLLRYLKRIWTFIVPRQTKNILF